VSIGGLLVAAALCCANHADGPVRVVSTSDTTLELELRTAPPSSSGGAVSLSGERVRFVRRADSQGWRLEQAAPGAIATAALSFDVAGDQAMRTLDKSIAEVHGERAVIVPLHEGDAAICVLDGGVVREVFLADTLIPSIDAEITAARAANPGKPTTLPAFVCLRYRIDKPGSTPIRAMVLGSMDERAHNLGVERLAARSFEQGSDIRTANTEAARAAIDYAQPEPEQPRSAQHAFYRWALANLGRSSAMPSPKPVAKPIDTPST